MRMYNPPHPGEILNELWLQPLNLTITQTAQNLNVTRKTVSALVNGKTGVSPEMALRLELAKVPNRGLPPNRLMICGNWKLNVKV